MKCDDRHNGRQVDGIDSKKRVIFLLLLLASCYIFFFYSLGGYSLKEPDEGRYAEIPREMVEQGDYLVPHLNYVRYFEKPPLLYWVTAASYKLFGVSEWSFRFPNALVAFLCVLLLYWFSSRWFGRKCAILSSLLLTSSFGFFVMARGVTTDMLFAVLLFATLLFFNEFYRERRSLFLYLFYVSLGLAVLAKGPVAIILMGATTVLFLLTERRLSFLRTILSPLGLLVFAIVAAPWFVVISLKEEGFFHFFFIDQHILRFLTTKHRRSGPIYYFLPVLLGGMFPWSFIIPTAVASLWRRQEVRLFLLWSLVVFLFFSVSGSKLPPYILPIYPALALVLGRFLVERWEEPFKGKAELLAYVLFFGTLGAGCFLLFSGLPGKYLSGMVDVTETVKSVRGLVMMMGSTSLAILVLLLFRKMRSFRTLFLMLFAFSFLSILGLMLHAPVIDRFTTAKHLAKEVLRRSAGEAAVISYGSFNETLPFYLTRRIYLCGSPGELEMGFAYPDAKGYFLDNEGFLKLWEEEKPVFVVTKEKRALALDRLGIDKTHIVARQDDRVLYANDAALKRDTDGPSTINR
jgi:hypothetical protein